MLRRLLSVRLPKLNVSQKRLKKRKNRPDSGGKMLWT